MDLTSGDGVRKGKTMKFGTAAPVGVEGESPAALGTEGLHPALVQLRRHALGCASTIVPGAASPFGHATNDDFTAFWLPDRRLQRPGNNLRGTTRRLAQVVSHGASPPVMAAAAFVLTAATLPGARPWLWLAVHLATAVLAPLAVLVAMRRRGEVADLELTRRDQRGGPLLLTLLCTGFSLFVQATAGAPAALVALTTAWLVLAAGLAAVTRWWKISVHAAAVAAAGAVLWRLEGSPVWLLAGVTAMGTARVALGRHTVAQTAAGALLGAGAVILLAGL